MQIGFIAKFIEETLFLHVYNAKNALFIEVNSKVKIIW